MSGRAARYGAALVVGLSLLAACPSRLSAHELRSNTARITLRDDHVDVQAELDVLGFIRRASSIPSNTALAALNDAELGSALDRARGSLEREAHLDADGAPIGVELRGFPDAAQLRAVANWLSTEAPDHGELMPVRLEATRAAPGARRISLSFPEAVGPVLVTFVQPASRSVAAGAPAVFSVLAVPARGDETTPRGVSATWLAGASVVLAVAAVLSNLALRRRTPAPPHPG